MKLQAKQESRSLSMVKNSAWGIGANILQVLFASVFFAIIARKYAAAEFAQFLISTTIYQLIAAFSSMGLGQWFIRAYITEEDKEELTSKFLKTQLGLGVLFYLINIVFAYSVYPDGMIRWLSIILGTNIIFDNFINAIRSLNIVESRQDKTALIMVIDGFLRLIVGCLLFINPFTTIILAILTIIARLVTVTLFLKIGSSATLTLKLIKNAQLSLQDLRALILKNWRFMVIGSVSIIYWRAGNIIISKTLSLADVADYELAFRIFSIFLILPVIASATVYPQLIRYITEKNGAGLKQVYSWLFFIYTGAAILAYSFIFSFSNIIIPLVFGPNYPNAIACLQQMFLSFLIMPTVLLQANLIIALGLERKDMQFNLLSLLLNVVACLMGLYFYKSLAIVNYAILISLLSFHLLQDFLLVRKRIVSIRHCLVFYSIIGLTVVGFQLAPGIIGLYHFYILFTIITVVLIAGICIYKKEAIFTMMGRRLQRREESW